MTTQICTKCKIEKPFDSFSLNKTKKTGYSFECKECHKIARKSYYENNKEIEKQRASDNKRRYAQWFKELKSSLKCEKCGEDHISCLQFHHLDRTEKEFGIHLAVHRRWSKERILSEISKCQVLCANCHFKVHWEERNACVM